MLTGVEDVRKATSFSAEDLAAKPAAKPAVADSPKKNQQPKEDAKTFNKTTVKEEGSSKVP